jgi:spore coat protein H
MPEQLTWNLPRALPTPPRGHAGRSRHIRYLCPMRHLLLLLPFLLPQLGLGQNANSLWDDSQIASIRITMPSDSLDSLLVDPFANHEYISEFIYSDGVAADTLQMVGFRYRGNTSRNAEKPSFKVSFNTYSPGRRYQGSKKLNLIGMHNDPTLIRQKLFYEVWNKAGMPSRRCTFVDLYINGVYRGLYTNAEEMDKDWLTVAYGENDGNLYKCTYPADLAYLGSNPTVYQNLGNGFGSLVYELKTNESNPDFSGLAQLITLLDQTPDAAFAAQIQQLLDVEGVLKAFAIDVATGNWDDYAYNSNNYFLYHQGNGQFSFITYDTDNTFGIDWVGRDWATRDCNDWVAHGSPRPLLTKLLAVPAFHFSYLQHLDSITRFLTCPDSIFPRIAELKALIIPSIINDTFRSLDYGYTYQDFDLGFTGTVDGHTPYGIQPFLSTRCSSTTAQLEPLLDASAPTPSGPYTLLCYPNPGTGAQARHLFTQEPRRFDAEVELCDISGKVLKQWNWAAGASSLEMSFEGYAPGIYLLHVQGKALHTTLKIVVE